VPAPQIAGEERARAASGEHALLRRYFAEIGHIPVLTAEAERDLARRLREAEGELRGLLERLPFTARWLLARWEAIHAEGRVTGQLSREHEPPARDRSAAVDRIARALARLLAAGAEAPSVAARVRTLDPKPELLHEVLAALREAVRSGAEPSLAATLVAAERADARGREAKDRFIRHNLRLVVNQAKGFRHYGVPFLDLIQEGTLGLIRAVEKYDERLGNRFSTYAIWWIQQSCMRAVQQTARTVRLPAPVQDEIRRYRRTLERFATRRPDSPRSEEVGRVLGLGRDAVDGLARLDRAALRLDEPVPGRERGSLGDQLADGAPRSDEDADRVRVEREIALLLGTLPQRDREILRARFGFADGEARTLQDVARTLGLSRERVRQLEQRALVRLAESARSVGLDGWLTERALSG
jgi:RNA polymerase sigma factor (sigma-70 family)